MSYDFLRRIDIDIGEAGDSVQLEIDKEKKLLRITLFKNDHYQDEIKVDLVYEFTDSNCIMNKTIAHCPTCGHHLNPIVGELTTYCPICNKDVEIHPYILCS